MPKPLYANLEVHLGKTESARYTVQLILNNTQYYPADKPAYFQPQFPWVSTAHPDEDGARLFDQLMTDSALRSAWTEIRGQHLQRRIRWLIAPSAPELFTLPWELLRDTTDTQTALAMSESTPFSRYYAASTEPPAPLVKTPLKMLVVIANPIDLSSHYNLSPIDSEREWHLLTTHLKPSLDLVKLPMPCTLSAIQQALSQDEFALVHLIAHGRYSPKTKQGALLLANSQNHTELVTAADFASIFNHHSLHRPRLIFLASCQTAVGDHQTAFRDFASTLFRQGQVPAVLAMQDFIAVETAQQFSQLFYQQMCQHGQTDLACNQARAAIATAKLTGEAVPVLFSRLPDNQLFTPQQRDFAAIGLRRRLDREAEWAWVNAMLECLTIKNTPDQVKNDLRAEIAHNIRQNAAPRIYIKNMVNTCASYPGGLEELLEILGDYEGNSSEMQHLLQVAKTTVPDLQL